MVKAHAESFIDFFYMSELRGPLQCNPLGPEAGGYFSDFWVGVYGSIQSPDPGYFRAKNVIFRYLISLRPVCYNPYPFLNNQYPFSDFQTKTAKKRHPLGPHITI